MIWHVQRWGRPYFTERQLWRSMGSPPPEVRHRVRQWLRLHPAFFRDRHARFYLRVRAVSWSGCIWTDVWDRPWFEPTPETGLSFRLPVMGRPGLGLEPYEAWRGHLRPVPHRRRWQKFIHVRGNPLIFWPEAPAPERPCRGVTPTWRSGPFLLERPLHRDGLWSVTCRDYGRHPWAARVERAVDSLRVDWYVGVGPIDGYFMAGVPMEPWSALGFRFLATSRGALELKDIECCRVQVEHWIEPTEATRRLRTLGLTPGPAPFFYAPMYPAVPCHLWVHPHVDWGTCLYDWYVQMERAVVRALSDRGVAPVGRTGEVPIEGVWWLLLWLTRHTGRLKLRRLWVDPSDWDTWAAQLPDEDRIPFQVALWTHGGLHVGWRVLRDPSDWAPLPIWQAASNGGEALWQDWLTAVWRDGQTPYPPVSPQADVSATVSAQRVFLAVGGAGAELSEAVVMAALPEGLAVLLGPVPRRAWVPAETLRAAGYFFKTTTWEWRCPDRRQSLWVGSRLSTDGVA
ncbi:MAG: hypothetical protein NZ742_02420 [Acidobacteria bacterium]|nr:hypothetical protein [Acidobacteriota bacterium]MDW7983825.1 hypothetical protein [Acidobacteriota bacterium]